MYYCHNCNKPYNNKDSHICVQESAKETIRCENCNAIIKTNQEHKCGFEICGNCREEVETATHECYMQPCEAKCNKCHNDKCRCQTLNQN